ncbi:MAG TPA: 4-alpha-glucanotransferase [Bryobacteraceae bacterium]
MALAQNRFAPSTSYEDALARAAAECGIDLEYWDIFHKKHQISTDGLRRILQVLGWNVASHAAIDHERLCRLTQSLASPLPKTLVVGESAKQAPLTVPGSHPASVRYEILLEDGHTLAGSAETPQLPAIRETLVDDRLWLTYQLDLPRQLPLGYHILRLTLNAAPAAEAHLIVCPDRAWLPDNLAQGGKTAGFNIALYGLRSHRNWGCGDFTDLHALIEWARRDIGFSFIGLNPLHALHNRVPYNTSPYLPLSVYYKNLIYLDIERVPEYRESACAQAMCRSPRVQDRIRRMRESEFVDYHGVDRLKKGFLRLLYRQFRRDQTSDRARGFAAYCRREGDLLHKFALYCALDEVLHKQDRNRWTWRDWPPEYQSPDSEAARHFAAAHPRTVEFYKYVQFVLDEQLSAAQAHAKESGMEIGLYHDLAVATDSCGSDLWAHRGFYVDGCRVGAPPDDFSPKGQDWGFPPPNVEAHRDNGYCLYRESIRKIVNHGGALRLDHVMRLFRLFWIPQGMEAAEGTYVRDHAIDLIRILALESVRSRNIIIGEDLGTVTDEIRDTLAAFGILSYRLFYFEKHPQGGPFKNSHEYPRQALVASATHDLATLAGFWQGRDIEARKAAGLADEAGYRTQMDDRRREKQSILDILHAEHLLPDSYERNAENLPDLSGDLHNAVIGFLAQVSSEILLLNQEDFTKETEQQNLPGSTAQYPNWQRKMKVPVEELGAPHLSGYANMFRDQLRRTRRAAN